MDGEGWMRQYSGGPERGQAVCWPQFFLLNKGRSAHPSLSKTAANDSPRRRMPGGGHVCGRLRRRWRRDCLAYATSGGQKNAVRSLRDRPRRRRPRRRCFDIRPHDGVGASRGDGATGAAPTGSRRRQSYHRAGSQPRHERVCAHCGRVSLTLPQPCDGYVARSAFTWS